MFISPIMMRAPTDYYMQQNDLVRGMIYSDEVKTYCEGRELGKQVLDRASENSSSMKAILESDSFTEETFLKLMYADAISSITKSDTMGEVLLIPREYLNADLDYDLKKFADISRGLLDEIVDSLKKDKVIKK